MRFSQYPDTFGQQENNLRFGREYEILLYKIRALGDRDRLRHSYPLIAPSEHFASRPRLCTSPMSQSGFDLPVRMGSAESEGIFNPV